jgi:hypothetical protein
MVFKKGDKVLIKAVREKYQKDLPFIGRIGVIKETIKDCDSMNDPMDGEQDYLVRVEIGGHRAYIWADVCEVIEIFEVLEGL